MRVSAIPCTAGGGFAISLTRRWIGVRDGSVCNWGGIAWFQDVPVVCEEAV